MNTVESIASQAEELIEQIMDASPVEESSLRDDEIARPRQKLG